MGSQDTVGDLKQGSPTFLALRTNFMENNFSADQEWGDGFRMFQMHDISCALYFLM